MVETLFLYSKGQTVFCRYFHAMGWVDIPFWWSDIKRELVSVPHFGFRPPILPNARLYNVYI